VTVAWLRTRGRPGGSITMTTVVTGID